MSDKPDQWSVFDLNAYEMRDGKPVARTHDIKPGLRVHLFATEPTYMPEEHARVFLRDPAFKVLNAKGEEVPSLEASQLARKPPEQLDPGQVVAKLEELTDEALLTRAVLTQGGADFTENTPREQMIDLIFDHNAGLAMPASGFDDEIGNDGLRGRALDRLLPNDDVPPRPPRGSNVARIKQVRRTADVDLQGA